MNDDQREQPHGRRASDKSPADALTDVVEALEKRYEAEMAKLALKVRQTRIFLGAMYAITFLALVIGGAIFQHEADQREDGQCRIFEGDQRAEVEELADTYQYLLDAQHRPKRARDTQLYQFALARLPQTVAKAREDQAPSYCDAEGVGEPEPDPVVPEQPPDLKLPPLPPG